jgi:hypothetical protein
MGQVLKPERWGGVTKTSSTTVSLALSDYSDIVANLGGQQYFGTTALTCNLSTSGAGGLDTGVIAANSTYYLWLVYSSNQLKLVASLSETAPTGFTTYRMCGGCKTYISSAQVEKVSSYITEFLSAASETVAVMAQVPSGQTLADVTVTAIPYTTVLKDTHGAFNTSTKIFTAPMAGFYNVSAMYGVFGGGWSGVNEALELRIKKNSSTVYQQLTIPGSSVSWTYSISGSCVVYLLAGETVTVEGYQASGASKTIPQDEGSYLSIFKI